MIHAVLCCEAGCHQSLGGAGVDHGGRGVDALHGHLDVWFRALVLVLDVGGYGVDHSGEGLLVGRLHAHHSHGVACDGVVEVAGVDACQAVVNLLAQHIEDARYLLGGACQPLVDVGARVPAHELAELDGEIAEVGWCGLGLIVEQHGGDHTAGAANGDYAVVLAVEVEQVVAHEHVGLYVGGTGEACLLVNGGECLERAALDVGVGEGGKGDGQSEAVVSAEGGAVGKHPFAVHYAGFDRVGEEVMI